MKPSDIQSKLQAAAVRFTDEVIAVFGEAFSSVASDLAVEPPGTRKPAAKRTRPSSKQAPARNAPAAKRAPNAARLPAAKKAAAGKRSRRSGEQLVADEQRIVKLLAANNTGLRVEQINQQLGAPPKQLARPILALLANGKIRKTGEKRGTLYFPV